MLIIHKVVVQYKWLHAGSRINRFIQSRSVIWFSDDVGMIELPLTFFVAIHFFCDPKIFFWNRLLQLFELQFVLMIPAISSKVTTFWLYLGRWINPMHLGCSNHQVGQTVPMQLFVRTWNTRSAVSVIVCHASFFLLTLFSKVWSITSG